MSAVRCWSPRHTTSVALDRRREKAASRAVRGRVKALHLHSRHKRGWYSSVQNNMVRPRTMHMSHHLREQASTQQYAFLQEVATSDLGGTRRKKVEPSGKYLGKAGKQLGVQTKAPTTISSPQRSSRGEACSEQLYCVRRSSIS